MGLHLYCSGQWGQMRRRAVHGCHCPGDMAVRMRKVLAIYRRVSGQCCSTLFDLSSGNLEKLPIASQNAVRLSARFTFCQPASVEPAGKKLSEKGSGTTKNRPRFLSSLVFNLLPPDNHFLITHVE